MIRWAAKLRFHQESGCPTLPRLYRERAGWNEVLCFQCRRRAAAGLTCLFAIGYAKNREGGIFSFRLVFGPKDARRGRSFLYRAPIAANSTQFRRGSGCGAENGLVGWRESEMPPDAMSAFSSVSCPDWRQSRRIGDSGACGVFEDRPCKIAGFFPPLEGRGYPGPQVRWTCTLFVARNVCQGHWPTRPI